MRSELKKILSDLHAMRMRLDTFFNENAEALVTYKLKDGIWSDTYQWKLDKSLESLFYIEKLIIRMCQGLPKVKRSKTEHIEQMTKADLLRNLLNMIGDRLEEVMINPEDISIETLLELQEVLVKLKEDNNEPTASST